MKGINTSIDVLSATVGGFLGWFLGGIDGTIYALLLFVIVDYITGIMVAVVNKKLSSEIGFRGIFKKVIIFFLVGIGSVIDELILNGGSVLRTAIIFFYIANEGISILENVNKIGLPVPNKLIRILESFKEQQASEDIINKGKEETEDEEEEKKMKDKKEMKDEKEIKNEKVVNVENNQPEEEGQKEEEKREEEKENQQEKKENQDGKEQEEIERQEEKRAQDLKIE